VLEFCELFCVSEFGVSGLVLSTAGLSLPPPPQAASARGSAISSALFVFIVFLLFVD
jgi:hypothetical protein